jgi:hypothetical protein
MQNSGGEIALTYGTGGIRTNQGIIRKTGTMWNGPPGLLIQQLK